MKLKSFGCSFIFGTDLHDSQRPDGRSRASEHTWPALIARELGRDYYCYANPGAGNLRIMQHVLDNIAIDEGDSVFVIGWTWIERFDYIDPHDSDERYLWKTICAYLANEEGRFYYRNIHTEMRDKLTNLTYIYTVIEALERRGIPFVMTCMDELVLDQRWHAPPGVVLMQERIRPYLHSFEGQDFLAWSRKNKFEISDTAHPLEGAHVRAAEIMLPQFEKYR